MISHHSTKSRGNKHSDRGDIMVLAYHMKSPGHVIKGS